LLERRNFALLPTLVPQDTSTRFVYSRCEIPGWKPQVDFGPMKPRPQVQALEFVGKADKIGKTRLLLFYPTGAKEEDKEADMKDAVGLRSLLRPVVWKECTIEIDLA